ncbi:hypothetical protein R3P38DRAFT_3170728 [Favolaschia claudopus]|uniref:Uncharacterized protein n=1 Tax=Favolaschia claudopus TaxID=2862362 RepID=A0AAW0DUF4_9AGAR
MATQTIVTARRSISRRPHQPLPLLVVSNSPPIRPSSISSSHQLLFSALDVSRSSAAQPLLISSSLITTSHLPYVPFRCAFVLSATQRSRCRSSAAHRHSLIHRSAFYSLSSAAQPPPAPQRAITHQLLVRCSVSHSLLICCHPLFVPAYPPFSVYQLLIRFIHCLSSRLSSPSSVTHRLLIVSHPPSIRR